MVLRHPPQRCEGAGEGRAVIYVKRSSHGRSVNTLDRLRASSRFAVLRLCVMAYRAMDRELLSYVVFFSASEAGHSAWGFA